MHTKTASLSLFLALAGSLAACSDGSGPSARTQLRLGIASRSASAANSVLSSVLVSDASHTLELKTVELVLRDISLKRVEDGSCPEDDNPQVTGQHDGNGGGDGDHGDNDGDNGQRDACESFRIGPFLASLPLAEGVVSGIVTVTPDPGTYDEVRIKIHKPREDSGDPADVDFLAQHPDLKGISIRVTYSLDGGPDLQFTSDLEAKEKIEIPPPGITIDATTTSYDVTVKVDVTKWFVDGSGNVIDPASAGTGGANQELVRNNIRGSFRAFHDDNHDCHNDDGSDD
jgi:hypothetical protein